MNVGWLIDGDVFPMYLDELVKAIKSHGQLAKVIHAPSPPYTWEDAGCSYHNSFPADHCVITVGDIGLVTRILQERRWTPGAFATIQNYFCSSYFRHFGAHWLNRDHILLPFEDLIPQKSSLFETYGRDGRIFVRPDSPLKLFTGQTAGFESFESDVDYMGFYEFPQDSLVVVSTPKQVIREWRFVVVNQSVVTGSLYSENGIHQPKPSVDKTALALAEDIASTQYAPDPVWIIDICQTSDSEYHLLEIGGFSFADLYACDKMKIVKAVSEAAISVWKANPLT